MPRVLVLCQNEDCRDGVKQSRDPRPMECTAEFASAWTFKCKTCGWMRVWTKDHVGGVVGVGRRDDGSGPTTAKGPDRFRPLGGIMPRESKRGAP